MSLAGPIKRACGYDTPVFWCHSEVSVNFRDKVILRWQMSTNHYLSLPPSLDEFESVATLGRRSEMLSAIEYEILSQLLRYPEEPLSRDALKRAAGFEDDSIPDRKLDAWLTMVIRKMNVLWPLFPTVRFVGPDSCMYSEKPPKKPEQ